VGLKNATRLIADGAIITVDVTRGLVFSGTPGGLEVDETLDS
jgi:phosphohistidine swiveling domain-containing protein